MNPKVSVIVPNYNHAPYLGQRIDSILNQSFQDFELILLDDCSTDNSRDVLEQYRSHPKVSHCIFNTQNSGSTFRQWEKGFQLAQGEYIWIAESDDWAENNFLEILMTKISDFNDVGLVYSASKLIDSEGHCTYQNVIDNTGEIVFFNGREFIEKKMLTANSIWNASMMVFRKSLFSEVVNNDYRVMKYTGDWLLYVQFVLNTNVLEVKQTLNNYRIHDGNVSTNAKKEGKYFTEGLDVFEYITGIAGLQLPAGARNKWAKEYVKRNNEYGFPVALKHEIKIKLKKLSKNMVFAIHYQQFKLKCKSCFRIR